MANPNPIFFTIAFFVTVVTTTSATYTTQREKLTHLHFYLHDIVVSDHPTAVTVAEAATTNSSATAFGKVSVIDDPLTEGPEPESPPVGSAQGMYTFSSQSDLSLLLVTSFVFTSGEFNGSTISVLGRDRIFDTVREMPIVGGSGAFRFPRGYFEFRTHDASPNGNAVLDVNVYVLHYY